VPHGAYRVLVILDNGSTHAPNRPESRLQEHVPWNHRPVTSTVRWLPTHPSWLHRIARWFGVLPRTLLPPHHVTSLPEPVPSMMALVNGASTVHQHRSGVSSPTVGTDRRSGRMPCWRKEARGYHVRQT
jgi:hypothetical protein